MIGWSREDDCAIKAVLIDVMGDGGFTVPMRSASGGFDGTLHYDPLGRS